MNRRLKDYLPGFLFAMVLAVPPVVLHAQKPTGEPVYMIPPALAGNLGKIFVGTYRGTILYAVSTASGVSIVDSAIAGGTLPAEVDGVWYLSTPSRGAQPNLVVGLASYTEGGTRYYGILRSTDLGGSWTLVKPAVLKDAATYPVTSDFWTVPLSEMTWLPDGMHGWLFGNKGIVRTTDGGITWTVANLAGAQTEQVRSLAFRDADNGVAAIGWWVQMTFKYTTDGGATWTSTGKTVALKPVLQMDWLYDTYVGFGIDRTAKNGALTTFIYTTDDLGTSWTTKPKGNITREQTYMSEILWAGNGFGYMVLRSMEIWATSDRGGTWSLYQNADSAAYPMPLGLQGGFGYRSILLDNRIIHVSTRQTSGGIYRLLQTAATVASAPEPPAGSSEELGAAPNPARDGTRLSFELAAPADARISIVDMLGREVRSIDAGRLDAGPQSVMLDLAGLAGGSYRCVVQAGATRHSHPLVIAR